MKNYTITVNGVAYDVVVEEKRQLPQQHRHRQQLRRQQLPQQQAR